MSASSINFSGTTTLLTKPNLSASYADMNSPVSINSIAFDFPIALINRYVPPHPGIFAAF